MISKKNLLFFVLNSYFYGNNLNISSKIIIYLRIILMKVLNMNYYNEIKNELINNEFIKKEKYYSKNRNSMC